MTNPRYAVPVPEPSLVTVLPISSLLPADSPRLSGEDAEHVKALAQTYGSLPPIVVHRPTMRVIDGMHRLQVARLKGANEIEVLFFEGDEDAAFILAVESNVSHGLPLTLPERIAAATRILDANSMWSDRAVAVKTGLAAATVAGIRERSGAEFTQSEARLGRDGRIRPLDGAPGRRMASAFMTENPGASLREVAGNAGISLATAHDVRTRLDRGDNPVPPGQRAVPPDRRHLHRVYSQDSPPAVPDVILQKMRCDPSLRYSETGRAIIAWLTTHNQGIDRWREILDQIPPHCLGIIAELARGYAHTWRAVADDLENRPLQEDNNSQDRSTLKSTVR